MAGVKDMPDEILVEIFRLLTYERATLHCLATLNKKISVLAIQTLSYNIDIFVQTEEKALSSRYDLLMASLNRQPELSVWPREIIIRCERRRDHRRQQLEDPNIRANELLRRLPNIRSLTIDWNDKRHPFMPAFLRHMEYRFLKEVTFLAGQSSLDQLGAFKTTKNLSSIVAKTLDPASRLSIHPLDPDPARRDSSRLKLMDLGGSHFPHTELRKLFGIFPTITTLDCALPGQEPSYGSYMQPRPIFMNSPLSPGLVAQAFAPLQEGLTSLRLNDGPVHTLWGGCDSTQMDLSCFTCLKVLHVPSKCYFEGSPEAQRKSMRTLLPPSLEEFKIWFDMGYYFLYAEKELSRCFPNGQYNDSVEVESPERYEWLIKLIGANLLNHNHLRLRKVIIEERIFQVTDSSLPRHLRHLWELPSALHKLCNDAEVTLEVRLRKPLGHRDGLN